MNPISIVRYSVNVIMSHMLRRLCSYDLLISNIEAYLITIHIKVKILLTDKTMEY
jgi:hypothetical protein